MSIKYLSWSGNNNHAVHGVVEREVDKVRCAHHVDIVEFTKAGSSPLLLRLLRLFPEYGIMYTGPTQRRHGRAVVGGRHRGLRFHRRMFACRVVDIRRRGEPMMLGWGTDRPCENNGRMLVLRVGVGGVLALHVTGVLLPQLMLHRVGILFKKFALRLIQGA